ncbi:MAG: very short patch repair endonuclease [Gammaproteobacteria bacterium]
MADVFDKEKRSWLMGRVKSRGNRSTERAFAAILRRRRIAGWRRGWPLLGSPDFVFPAARAAVFVDGCFWHGCPIHGTTPKTNRRFWREKIARNIARDKKVSRCLRRDGWHVFRFWEHDLKKKIVLRKLGRLRRIVRD